MAERASSSEVGNDAPVRLSPRALLRYSRHLIIPEVALAGQERLGNARVLVVGAGGLGSPVLEYLAAGGTGRIGIADDDVVDETNLQRQTLFATNDIGKKKVDVARDRLLALNPLVAVDAIPLRVDATNARELVRLYDIVLDCTDRFEARYLINDACYLENKPDVYASIVQFRGQVSVFHPSLNRDAAKKNPCYRCLFPEPPAAGSVPTCAESGVLGVLAGVVGTWQANEALKFILNIGEPLIGRMLLIDTLAAAVREVRYERDPGCVLCGDAPSISEIQPLNYDARLAF